MKSSLRRHLRGSVTATAIWNADRERYQAGAVEESGDPRVVSDEVCGGDLEAAQERADMLVLAAYPHECFRERCEDWTSFGRSTSEKRP